MEVHEKLIEKFLEILNKVDRNQVVGFNIEMIYHDRFSASDFAII